jgi:polyisoprenoid-binding protein YceI
MKSTIVLTAGLLFSFAVHAQSVTVDIVMNPMGDFKAKTDKVTGNAVKKGASFEASNVVVDLKSLKTERDGRDTHMKEKYLQVDKFPTATLISAKGTGGKGTGKIRIRGIEKDISGTYKEVGKNIEAQFPLKLSDFGINDVGYKGVGVEDKVTVHIVLPVK